MSRSKKFGPFILERLIGRGGMGAVYQATNETTGQTVAVKALLVPLEEERERFEAEISTLKLLRHENIVKLYGFGQEDGVLYYAMEFVPGPSLATLLKRGRRFTWEETVYIGVSVCKALKHAHDRGVVHRDVKPANILLLDGGGVKVSDYGIAQYFGNSRLTGANQVVGTIEYMAPEQAQAGPLTPRTDVYALGALLYALLTGTPPYPARSLPELLRRYREGAPESIRFARPEAPKVLDAFLMELLQISPEKRPSDARLIGRRLEGILRTASSCPNGNPFCGRRFSISGEPADDAVSESSSSNKPSANFASESRVDLENPSAFDFPANLGLDDANGAPDFPYRAVVDDASDDVRSTSPFDRTTELDASEENANGATTRAKSETKNSPTDAPSTSSSTDASADDGFDLGEFSLKSDAEPRADASASPDKAATETVFCPRRDLNATTTSTLDETFGTSNEDASDPGVAAPAFVGVSNLSDKTTDFPNRSTQTQCVGDANARVKLNSRPPESSATSKDVDDEGFPLVATPLEKFKKSRFTPVDERDLGKLPIGETERRPLFVAVAQIAGTAVALVAVAALFWIALRPPTADALYRRIEKTLADERGDETEGDATLAALRRAEDDLVRFSELYPNDSRTSVVRYYLSELELDVLEQRVEREIQRNQRIDSTRPPIERAYIAAARAAKNDLDDGIVRLTAFVDLFESNRSPDADVRIVENASEEGEGASKRAIVALPDQLVVVAKRRLKRLQEERDKARRADLELLNDRLDVAESLQETAPKRAEEMRAALLALYADRPWAQKALERARLPEESMEKPSDAPER